MPHTEQHRRGAFQKGYSIEDLIGPNFIERYQNRELGKETIDDILGGLEQEWNNLDEGTRQNIIGAANWVGDAYSKARSIDETEKYNPIAYAEAGALRTIEGAVNIIGGAADMTLGNLGRGAGWMMGLDPRAREALAVGSQLYLGPKAIRGLSKLKPKHLGISQSISKIDTLDDTAPYAKKLINITDDSQLLNIIDEPFKYDITTINRAHNLYKHHPDAGWKSALIRAQQLQGITPKALIKQGEGVYNPEVYIPPEERIGTQKGDPLEARFQYQGNFMFGPNGEVHWNKIDPAGQVAWQYWLESTAQKSGYASMKDMVKIFREWPDEDFQDFMHELWDGATGDGTRRNRFTYIGYSEHKKAKASKKGNLEEIRGAHPDWTVAQVDAELARIAGSTFDMDWLHDTEWIDHTGTLRTDGIGLGDRNQPKNMLALFDSQWKSLKDISEQVGYGTEVEPGPLFSFSDGTWRNPNQRFYIDVQDPGKQKQYLRQNPGEIVIKRASNHKVIGSLGAYLRALYPMDRGQESFLAHFALKSINPTTGKNFTSLAEFRKHIILERINIILNNTATLPSASKTSQTKRNRYITQKLQEDMVDLGEKYPFLKSIPEWTQADITEDYGVWRGQSNQSAGQGYKNIKNMKNINIGGTKASGTLKEAESNWIQKLIDGIIPDDR